MTHLSYYHKFLAIALSSFLFIGVASAQVTIGSGEEPEKAALLEIKSFNAVTPGGATTSTGGGGLLFSRVALSEKYSLKPFITSGETADLQKQHTGLVVYNIQAVTAQGLKEGLHVWDGTQWTPVGDNGGASVNEDARRKFFYMPAVPLNTSKIGEVYTVNLYDTYKSQFTNPKVKSRNAPDQIPVYESANDLYYYVTSYDEAAFYIHLITGDGIMYYTVNSTVNPWSYVNIVFVVK